MASCRAALNYPESYNFVAEYIYLKKNLIP